MRVDGKSAAVGLGAGLLVGIVVAERGRFVDWALDLQVNWDDLPAIIIGTSIPALAGVLLASRIAERDTARLTAAQVRASAAANRELIDAERLIAEQRRDTWTEIARASRAFGTASKARGAERRQAEEQRREQLRAQTGRRNLQPGQERDVEEHASIVQIAADARAAMTQHGDQLRELVQRQIEGGRVDDLNALLDYLDLMIAFAREDDNWLEPTLDAAIAARRDANPRLMRTREVVATLREVLVHVEDIATRASGSALTPQFDPEYRSGQNRRDARVDWAHHAESLR